MLVHSVNELLLIYFRKLHIVLASDCKTVIFKRKHSNITFLFLGTNDPVLNVIKFLVFSQLFVSFFWFLALFSWKFHCEKSSGVGKMKYKKL